MIEFKNIEGMYFVGIGGIGMSALALYFAKGGYTVLQDMTDQKAN
jgi:UDP-N-acetylmuramate-alanine ligase